MQPEPRNSTHTLSNHARSTSILFVYHVYLICNNCTTLGWCAELVWVSNMLVLFVLLSQHAPLPLESMADLRFIRDTIRGFSLPSAIGNIQEVFGPPSWHWLLPVDPPPSPTLGIEFPYIEGTQVWFRFWPTIQPSQTIFVLSNQLRCSSPSRLSGRRVPVWVEICRRWRLGRLCQAQAQTRHPSLTTKEPTRQPASSPISSTTPSPPGPLKIHVGTFQYEPSLPLPIPTSSGPGAHRAWRHGRECWSGGPPGRG